MSKQPEWECIANLGDVDPVDYGGYFVLRDKTGVHEAEAEFVDTRDDGTDVVEWTVYRFILDKCTYIDGVLSDNKYHPEHPAWFNELRGVAAYCGVGDDADVDGLIAALCSENPIERADAYSAVAEYHGWENFDSYPLTFTDRAEAEARYAPYLAELKALKARA